MTDNEKLKTLISELAQQDSENNTDFVDVVRAVIATANFIQTHHPVSRAVYTTRLSEALSDPERFPEFMHVEQREVLDQFLREAPALVASALFV